MGLVIVLTALIAAGVLIFLIGTTYIAKEKAEKEVRKCRQAVGIAIQGLRSEINSPLNTNSISDSLSLTLRDVERALDA